MTVQRVKGYVGLSCDSCSESTEEFDDFDEMIPESKAIGWKITQEGGYWTHTCPGCADGSKPGETRLQRARRLLG